MAIVVEDGTGSDPNANSYVTVANLTSYASLRGVDLSNKTEPELEALLIKAMDYLEGQSFKGSRASATQPLSWPRSSASNPDVPGSLFANNEIPRRIEYGQYALAVEAITHDLQPTRTPTDKGRVVKERIEGAVEKVYDNTGKVLSTPAFAKAEALLSPLYKHGGLSLVRA